MKDTQANSGRKYRLYPTREQAERLTRWGSACRTLWNIALEQREFAWKQRGRTLRAMDQGVHLTQARGEIEWLADLPAQSGQQVLKQLDRAYDNWWNAGHRAGAPQRKRRGSCLSVSFTGQQISARRISRSWGQVRLPKIGWVRLRMSRDFGGSLRNATVKQGSDGVWHVTFGIAAERRPLPPNGKPGCGVDFGIACSAYVSDEDAPRLMPVTLTAAERRRLLTLERRKARQMAHAKSANGGVYSSALRETLTAIAALKARAARRRLDFTHKLTTELVSTRGWVAIEDLQVTSLTASARGTAEKPGRNVRAKAGINRRILDGLPGERRRQLAYKAPLHGSELRVVPPARTSQMCSACGVTDKANRPRCGRDFACTNCGYIEHADKNAALNIAALGRSQ